MNRFFKFSALWLVSLFVFSCGSSAENPQPQTEGFIRFKVDGVQREFKANPMTPMSFSFDSNGQVYNAILQVLGPGSNGTNNFIQFNVRNESPFVTNVDYQMQEAIAYQGVDLSRINFTYSNEEGQLYNAVLLKQALPNLVVRDDAKVRFTKITENLVEGTFSALLTGPVTATSVGNQELIISEGQFSIKLVDLTP